MAKAVLSKRDLEYLSKIGSQTEQNALRKKLLAERQANLERSLKAFGEKRARTKARMDAEPNVEVRTSKRGAKFIVVSGGGLMNSVWLSVTGASTLVSSMANIKALISEINTGTNVADVEGEDQE